MTYREQLPTSLTVRMVETPYGTTLELNTKRGRPVFTVKPDEYTYAQTKLMLERMLNSYIYCSGVSQEHLEKLVTSGGVSKHTTKPRRIVNARYK